MMFKKIRKKFGLYDLRKEVAKYVEKNFGTEFVEEALDKYDQITSGIPIGNFAETAIFLDMIERIKAEY